MEYLKKITAIVVGDNGTILKTTDNGASWVAINPPATRDFYGVHAVDEKRVLLEA